MTPEERNKAVHEFNAKFEKNQDITGYGMDVFIHMPCPFCAEPGFVKFRMLDVTKAMAKEVVCVACKRGMRTITKAQGNSTTMEFVQTRGDDPPEFMPVIRRVKPDTLATFKDLWAEIHEAGQAKDAVVDVEGENELQRIWHALTPDERAEYILERSGPNPGETKDA